MKGLKELRPFRHSAPLPRSAGQTAVEYLILLGVMTIIALTAFRTMLPRVVDETNGHFQIAAANIVGNVADPSTAGPWPFEENQ